MSLDSSLDKEIGRECRFAWHIPTRSSDVPDMHIVKEQISFQRQDGSIYQKPNIRYVKDFPRPYWIKKRNLRNYKQKREYAKIEELDVNTCTQSQLRFRVATSLGESWRRDSLRKLCESPYVYGCDISSTSLIKDHYFRKWPDLKTKYSLAVLDIETEMNDPEHLEDPIACSVVFENKAFLCVVDRFVRGLACPEKRTVEACHSYIGNHLDKFKMDVEVVVGTDAADILVKCIQKLHEWKPDWLAIWNMNFDIPVILRTLKKFGYDPKDVFCDPSIPEEFRLCEYKPGPTKQVTASGKVKPINPAAQWHTFELTASFYCIDAMCAYKHLRLGEQEESSYSLDYILEKKLGIRKLKFDQAKKYEGLSTWHNFMQANYKIEYLVYNLFDCISMLELDEQIKDLGYVLPAFSKTTDFWNFRSLPKKILDALHFFALERGKVMATAPPAEDRKDMAQDVDTTGDFAEHEIPETDEDDPEEYTTLSCNDWIVTLPAHLSVLGLQLIEEDPELRTHLRAFVYDSDSVSSYPSCVSVGNVSKTTTKREIIKINGIDESVFRMQNLNAVIGQANAIEYSYTMFRMPKPKDLLAQFERDMRVMH